MKSAQNPRVEQPMGWSVAPKMWLSMTFSASTRPVDRASCRTCEYPCSSDSCKLGNLTWRCQHPTRGRAQSQRWSELGSWPKPTRRTATQTMRLALRELPAHAPLGSRVLRVPPLD